MPSREGEIIPVETVNPEMWLTEYGDYLYGYAMKRVSDEHVAEELVQEALLTALEKRDTFEGRSSTRTWLVGILKFKVLHHYREKGRGAEEITEALGGELVDSQFNKLGKWKKGPANWGDQPGDGAEAEELRAVLADCLLKMPSRVAEALMLYEQQSLDGEKLAKVLEATTSQIYVMLHRARAALRKCMEMNWFSGKSGKEC